MAFVNVYIHPGVNWSAEDRLCYYINKNVALCRKKMIFNDKFATFYQMNSFFWHFYGQT